MEKSPKRVLDVGNCCRDHDALRAFLTRHFDCELAQAHGPDDAREQLTSGPFDLVLVNRKLDRDYSDGIEVIRQIKADEKTANVPVMLITNYPEHQQAAVAAGALRGFGKLEFENPATIERLAAVLGASQRNVGCVDSARRTAFAQADGVSRQASTHPTKLP